MRRETSLFLTLGLLSAIAPPIFAQDLQGRPDPVPPSTVLVGPQLIAWSELQKPQPVQQRAEARRAKESTKSKADRARGPIRAATRRWAERFWKSDTEQLAGVDDALRAIQCEQKPQWLKPDFFCALTARLESCPSRYSRLPDLLRPGPVAPTPYRSVKSFWAKREGERCKVNCIALPQRENLRFIIVRPRAVRAALRPPVRVHR